MMANHQDPTLAAIPKAVRLEFPRFKGDNPSGWIYKANQFFQLYNTLSFISYGK